MSAPDGNTAHTGDYASQKPRRQRPKKFGDKSARNNQNTDIIDFSPPMRKGHDFAEVPQNADVKQHPRTDRTGPRREEGPKNPNTGRGRSQPTHNADTSSSNVTPSFSAVPPHTIEAIAVLAQTLLPPPQMSELIRRLSSVMPKNTGAHATARQAPPMGANLPSSTNHDADDQGLRGGRGRGGRGRGGRGRGGRGRGGRGRGGRGHE